jgi:uncharacterized protein (UPF0335 family)
MKKASSGGIDADKLRTYAEQIIAAEDRKAEEGAEATEYYKSLKAEGYDTKALRFVLRLKKMESAKAQDLWRAIEGYAHALGLFDQADLITPAKAVATEDRPTA